MTLNWIALLPQIDALALHTALRAAQLGEIEWAAELAREHNRRWLSKNAPEVLARCPNTVEEGVCACGGVCLIFDCDEGGLLHGCTQCSAAWRVDWSLYAGEEPREASQRTIEK